MLPTSTEESCKKIRYCATVPHSRIVFQPRHRGVRHYLLHETFTTPPDHLWPPQIFKSFRTNIQLVTMHLCDACLTMRPNLHRTSSSTQIPLEAYKVHHDWFVGVARAKGDRCYVCARLWRTVRATFRTLTLHLIHPATFCIATTTAPEADNVMRTTTLRFYRKGQEEDDETMVPLDVFHCVPYSPST